jgi:hypothetical protein
MEPDFEVQKVQIALKGRFGVHFYLLGHYENGIALLVGNHRSISNGILVTHGTENEASGVGGTCL